MPSKYTIDDVKCEFENRGYILISDEYINSKTKLQYLCKQHLDYGIQEISFSHFHYRQQGCIICGRKKANINHRISEKDIKDLLVDTNWEYAGIDISGRRTIALLVCPLHRDKGPQRILIDSLRSGRGCKYCAKNVRLTQEEYIRRVEENVPHIKVLGTYVSQTTRISVKCLVHDKVWDVKPFDLLRPGTCGCSECQKDLLRNLRQKTVEYRKDEMLYTNPSIEIISAKLIFGETVKFRCHKCRHEWESFYPQIYFSGRSGCPECSRAARIQASRKTHEKFCDEISQKIPHIKVVGEYVNSVTPIKLYCSIHDTYFERTPNSLLNAKTGCPKCSNKHSENMVGHILDSAGIMYEREKTFPSCKDKNMLPFDYYLPEWNLIIEYDGEDHYMPIDRSGHGKEAAQRKFEYTQSHDSIKNAFCSDNGIKLIRIPYWEKKNIEEYLFQQLANKQVDFNLS